jgi:membrane peptidoglycan carboxypeptidase
MFGESSYLVVKGHPEVSVKTGTTNDRKDNWTIGYTNDAVVAVWVGNNDNTPMSGAVSGISGASPIWNKLMKNVLDKAKKYFCGEEGHKWPRIPDRSGNVCATSNLYCPESRLRHQTEYFLKTILWKQIRNKDVP